MYNEDTRPSNHVVEDDENMEWWKNPTIHGITIQMVY
jgi:hypothetical protein